MSTERDTARTGPHEIDVRPEERLLSPLESLVRADARTVYGAPVSVGEKTVIPVARVAFGLGMGGGSGGDVDDENAGEGFGGGGGARATPIGIVEVTPEETKFVRFGESRRLAGVLALGVGLGLAIGRLLRR
ncbi:spore germination protein GerW family protein [Haloferax namakaokahaiae]|uniref:Spore germination protein GerW family protein n=1 Tax=Haloferax namakaokahaiae TaxID=1748331 RepID=A0ABD5ZE65_9EURY